MKIFDTLSRRKEESVPLTLGEVKTYVCGPTAYSFIHIGNVRPTVVFDTVRRYFEYKGYDVRCMSNLTDMDDKIIKRAIEGGVDADTVPCRYIEEYKKDMAAMDVKSATIHPQAIREIYGMLEVARTLIDKDHICVAGDGTVYFRAGSFREYRKLSCENLNEFQSGFREIRVTDERGKEDPNDFMSRKLKKEGEPFWESPWHDGCPGWHVECSVMPKRYLGEQIDIYAGGEDLIFLHHKNEITQSECANDKSPATYWIHSGFLNIGNKKMFKSLGNLFTVRGTNEKYDLQVLRSFMLNARYCNPLSFSADLMGASKDGLECILACVEKLGDLEAKASDSLRTAGERGSMEEVDKLRGKYEEAMGGDFDTADVISVIFGLVKLADTAVDESSTREFISYMKTTIEELCDVLDIITRKKEEVLDSGIEEMIEARQQARKERNFAPTDEIRGKFLGMGVILEDIRKGVKWKRV